MANDFRNLILALLAGLFIAGCSGSTESDPGPEFETGELITITSANADQVAGVVAQRALEDEIFGAIGSGLPVASAGPGAAAVLTGLSQVPLQPGQMALQSTLEDCDVSGTVDISVNISDPTTISRNDEFRFRFRACDQGTGSVLNGEIIMRISSFSGDANSDTFNLTMSVELSAFTVTEDGEVSGATGTISIEIDSNPPVTTITVSASAIATTYNGVTEVLSSMSVTITENSGTVSVEVDTSFRISSPRLDGDVIVSTSIGLQSSGDGYPFMGELRITAANNTAIVLIVLDQNLVRLEIDIDGDGAPDEVRDLTWDELLAAAG